MDWVFRLSRQNPSTHIFLQNFAFFYTKYGKGLHCVIVGDTNRLNLYLILELSFSLRQCVSVSLPTRLNPPATLDPIITTVHKFYQMPITKPARQNDSGKMKSPLIIWFSDESDINTEHLPGREY